MSETICRLCLQTVSENNIQAIGESLLKTLKLNIKISEGDVMCPVCSNYLQVFSNIKTACVSKDRILSLPGLKNDVGLDAVEIETISNTKSLVESEIKCSFCPRTGKKEGFVSLNESRKHEALVNMLQQHIPEINLSHTEELLTCEPCLRTLQDVFNFILKCLEVEEKINKYTGSEGTDDKSQIELKDIQQFMLRPILNLKIESFGVNELGGGYCDEIKKEVKCEKEMSRPEFAFETAKAEIKLEAVDIQFGRSDCDGFQQSFIEDENAVDPLQISDMERHGGNIELIQKSASEIRKFKCDTCSYEAKQRGHLKYHLLTHGSSSQIDMLKCEMCSYETYRKSNLNRHSLTHKSSSEINMFKCATCLYETYRKENLKQHLLTHQSPSEINMFKCKMCLYETKHKRSLKNHSLVHQSPAEINMFKCETCSFETKRKSALKDHLLTHRSLSEINMFKCEVCPFETKHKSALTGHLLTHKSSMEINMFKCAMCSYETKRKGHLKSHLLTHRSCFGVKMFKCKTCSYKSKNEETLISHSLTHKNMFKCTMCEFVTQREGHLKRHLLKHADINVNVSKYKTCSYEL